MNKYNYKMNENKLVCVKCVMDDSDPDIRFDNSGVCNYCLEADKELPKYRYEEYYSGRFYNVGDEIKQKTKNSKYNCIIGLSGGVDSSYVALLAVKKLGLNPLGIHFDNGWNSDVSIRNIETIVNKLGIDYEAYVVDWQEFRSLQRAFIKASVIDLELLTDQAHKAAAYKVAKKNKIKFNLTGGNYVTEHGMPRSWYKSPKQDVRNIKDIAKKHENIKLKDYPQLGLIKYKLLNKLKLSYTSIPILNYINYNRTEAKKQLISELGWVDYGGKHHESFLTKFYQEYILPVKFNVDKRKVHFSAMIRNGEMTRDEALITLREKKDSHIIESDIEYFIKKLGFSRDEFDEIMKQKPVSHYEYKSDLDFFKFIKRI
jgi:N-acetyl sugar amidotransferase